MREAFGSRRVLPNYLNNDIRGADCWCPSQQTRRKVLPLMMVEIPLNGWKDVSFVSAEREW
jgi:hypothetical protein